MAIWDMTRYLHYPSAKVDEGTYLGLALAPGSIGEQIHRWRQTSLPEWSG